MAEIITLRFKYRGVFDYNRMYREGKKFFIDREMKFTEPVYKYKGSEFEGEWSAENKIDAYSMAKYTVKFKAVDMSPVTQDGVTMYNGKLQLSITAELDDHYKQSTPAGKEIIFAENKNAKDKESWLHKIYKKVTERDRYEGLAEQVFVTANNFQTLVKGICNVDTK